MAGMGEMDTNGRIGFDEKVRMFSFDYLKFCDYLLKHDPGWQGFTKKLYLKLSSTSQLLEDFLDYHGAKNNKNWYFYREMTAAVRHLSISCYSQRHITNRLVFYSLRDTEEFEGEGEITQTFLNRALITIAPVIIDEARRLGIPIAYEKYGEVDFPDVKTDGTLEYNIDDQDQDQQQKYIVSIASDLLNIYQDFSTLEFFHPYDVKELHTNVPEKINEAVVRRFEMILHNLQSVFDTYVIHGGYRFGNRKLKELRGLFSVALHLLQMTGRLLHFYERHLYEGGYKDTYKRVQARLSALIDADALLDRAINYGLFYASHFMIKGRDVAREILNENIERSSIEVGIPQKMGFHSRPCLLVAKIVQHYGGQVEMCLGEDKFDASSVLDLQWAGGKVQKEKIASVVFEGDTRALADIDILASVNYGEDIMGKDVPLPRELSYLR